MILEVSRSQSIAGSIRPPSEKSLTHRAYMFGAIATGPSVIHTPLLGEDCESTLRCLIQMGLKVERQNGSVFLTPAPEWNSPGQDLECGNSGTTMRLMSGLVAGQAIRARLVGDASLSRRPMGRVAEPLRLMGATIEGDRPPITIHGGNLKPIDFVSPVASAQVKSCVLLAGLFTDGITSVTEPSMSRNHTETMLARMGVHLNCINTKVSVEGGQRPRGFEMSIPADISSASFFIVAATLLDGPGLLIREMLINPTRTGVIDVLDQIGATYEIGNVREEMGEAVGDLFISANGRKPFIIEGDLVPRLIDEIPVLAVLATQLEGRSIIRNANEVRVKESDRLAVMAGGLSRMGAKVELLEDGLVIDGPTPLVGVEIDACLDHRIAMSFAIAGLLAEGTTKISGAESIATSFPGFVEELRRLTNV